MKFKKILHLNKSYFPHIGGVEKVVQYIAEYLNSNKRQIDVLACNIPKGAKTEQTVNGVRVIRENTLFTIKSSPLSINFLISGLKKFSKYNLIHLHEPFPLGSLICWLIPSKTKLVITWHSDIVRQKFLKLFVLPFQWLSLMRADIVIATSDNMKKNAFIRYFKTKTRTIPLSIPDNKIIKIVNDENFFLYIGRFVYYKGLLDLLDAAKIARIPMKLVGNGPLWRTVKSRVTMGGMDHIELIKGPVNEKTMQSFINRCSVLVFPSNAPSEAFGLVQLQAMAAGKPVINTWLKTGVPEVSIDGKTGITVNPSSPSELAAAMQRLYDNPKLRLTMGQNARARVKKHFVHSVTMPQINQIYSELTQ